MAQANPLKAPFEAFDAKLDEFTVRPKPVREKNGEMWHGQNFVLYDNLRAWLVGPSTVPASSNVDMLLRAAFKTDWGPDLKEGQVTAGDSACLLVFCILIELDQAELIHDFYKNEIVDRFLPMPLYHLQIKISCIAKYRHSPDAIGWAKELASKFDEKQWKYRPVKFVYEDSKSWVEQTVFPFMGRHLITDKGGTSYVYEVAVPSSFVDEHLRKKIGATEVEIEGIECCHFALKVFKDGHKHIFEDETKAYRVLSRSRTENNGMLSYLGHFSSVVSGKEQHSILLEYANNDLEGHFRRSPPFLPDAILQFWKDLVPVVFTLSELHEFEIGNSVNPTQKYEGWHADIKPDNILLVNDEFKLADPGFAKFQRQRQKDTQHRYQTQFTGGTTTFGAPERYLKGVKVDDPRSSDMWSIGCVLSESATWIVLGKLGVRTFRDLRRNAIEKLVKTRGTKLSASGECIESSDFFHDGEKVLPEVTQWHELLRQLLRPTDHLTRRTLKLVDEHLLLGTPKDRYSARKTYEFLEAYIKTADQDRKGRPLLLVAPALQIAIDDAEQREADELQDYINSQSNEQRQADKANPSYLQIPGPPTSGGSPAGGRRPSFDQPSSTLLAQTLSGKSVAYHLSTQTDLRNGSAGDPRPPGTGPPESLGSIISNTNTPQPNKETIFDTYYLSQKTHKIFGISLGRNQRRDDRLRKSVKARDLVFLVDNGQTMEEYWHETTFVLEMLYNKCTRLDDDGIDLYFTGGSEKVINAKGSDGLNKIRSKMLNSTDARPTKGCNTDMANPLTTLLNVWLNEYKRKKDKQKSLTIIALTDGKWYGNVLQPEAVDQAIIKFDSKLREHAGLTPDRSVSIQFVSFGDDPDALHRLGRLDNDLKYKGVADIVDTEPSHGDIYKMILGSIDETMDARNDPPKPRQVSPPPHSSTQVGSPLSTTGSSATDSSIYGRHLSQSSGSSAEAHYPSISMRSMTPSVIIPQIHPTMHD